LAEEKCRDFSIGTDCKIKEFGKGLVMMDPHLIDNADLDLLAEKCARWGLRFHVQPAAARPRARHRLASKSNSAF
jgi:hypothetical protein